MDYTISKADGTTLLSVPEAQTSASSGYSVTFVGKNFPAYGSYINNNFLRLLENSAKATAPAVPVKGQLWYDSTNNLVKAYNGSTWLTVGPSPLGDNIVITAPLTNGQVLKYNGTNWVNGTDATGGGGGASVLDDLTDVVITGTPTNGQVLKYDTGTGKWVNGTDATGGGGGGVSLPANASGYLKNNGSGTLTWATPPAPALDDLTDVVITSPIYNQVLFYNGTRWINGTADTDIEAKKKLFLLDKFGSSVPTVQTPNISSNYTYNVLSQDAFVARNTWSNRFWYFQIDSNGDNVKISQPSLQSFANTSGFSINLIIKVNVIAVADDATGYKFLMDGVVVENVPYNGNTFQQTLNYVYTYNTTLANGETKTFELQGLVGSGDNGRGADLIAAKMIINFGGWTPVTTVSLPSNPAAGTVLARRCNGQQPVMRIADGNGSYYEVPDTTPSAVDCVAG